MLCRNPYMADAGHAYPCGQCMPCRFNRRRVWAHRIMLEATQHSASSFVTLTYCDSCLPSDGSVNKKHLQDWLKRLRKAVTPSKLRYFAVGEYGDQTQRPHYHLAMFNLPTCHYGQTRWVERERACCPACAVVKETWLYGNSFLGALTVESAQYVSGYVTKKMTHSSDPRLGTRQPEFALMSLRPGIGATAMDYVASDMMQFNLEETQADVPSALRHGSRLLPLGRYLKRRLRERIGRAPEAPENPELKAEMLELRKVARSDPENPSVKYHLVKAGDQAALKLDARSRIFKKRGPL